MPPVSDAWAAVRLPAPLRFLVAKGACRATTRLSMCLSGRTPKPDRPISDGPKPDRMPLHLKLTTCGRPFALLSGICGSLAMFDLLLLIVAVHFGIGALFATRCGFTTTLPGMRGQLAVTAATLTICAIWPLLAFHFARVRLKHFVG